MNAVPFDTLKLARDLEAAGVAAPAAAGTASALADAVVGADLATKSDLAQVETRLRGEIGQSEGRVMAAIQAARADTALLESKLIGAVSGLDTRMELLRRDMTIKLGGMIFVAVGVILAALRFMPHP